MSKKQEGKKKRGPKGGIKHQPGRGHDSKSRPQKKKRYARKAKAKRKAEDELARKQWEEWDRLPDDVKKLLPPERKPQLPRPNDDA
jgi:hypothetical protein